MIIEKGNNIMKLKLTVDGISTTVKTDNIFTTGLIDAFNTVATGCGYNIQDYIITEDTFEFRDDEIKELKAEIQRLNEIIDDRT